MINCMNKCTSFYYSEIEGDQTKQEILKQERLYGYDPSKPLMLDFTTYHNLYSSIVDDKSILFSEYFPGFGVSEKQLRDSISIWDDLGIKLHEINILDSLYGSISEENFKITQKFVDSIKTGHPSELPITFNTRCKFYGRLEIIVVRYPFNNFNKNGFVYLNIYLSKHSRKITTCMYNHEITHTQLDSRNSCKSFLDSETIPILIEEIFANKMDNSGNTLEKIRNIRLYDLVRYLYSYSSTPNMDYVSRIESDTYIKSTLQAIQLANIYLTGNSNIRKEMQEYINRIFSEQISVEDMLNKYNANFDEVPKSLKKLKVPR